MRTMRGALAFATLVLVTLAQQPKPSEEPEIDYNDRVAMLMADREDPKTWCMGLLVAPDAVLTYASCAANQTNPLAWAFFGNSFESFHDERFPGVVKEPASVSSGANDSSSPRIESDQHGDSLAGSEAWAEIMSIQLHPKFNTTDGAATTDLAVIRLKNKRSVTPFALANSMEQNTDEAGPPTRSFRAFHLGDGFISNSRSLKLTDTGRFTTVAWRYCEPSQLKNSKAIRLMYPEPNGQVCAVANIVEDRESITMSNTFFMLDDKLVGLSAVSESASDSHRVVLLSQESEFISEATTDTDNWMDIKLIVGGSQTPALRGYVAGLRATKDGENFCLGALIAPKFVLTAAHCVEQGNVDQVSVGSLYSSTEIDGEQIKVSSITTHPAYNPATLQNDVAIIELQYISIQPPIVLFDGQSSVVAPGKRLTMVGYAVEGAGKSATQHYVDLPVVDKAKCKAILQPPAMDASMMCAGGEKGKDACHGDSGGPLVIESTVPEALVASASFGRGCGLKGMPAVYSVVANAAAFIDKYVDGHRWISAFDNYNARDPIAAPTSRLPTSSPPGGLPSSPPTSPSGNTEGRSNENYEIYAHAALHAIAKDEGWTEVPSISLEGLTPALVVGAQYSSFTRAVLATILLRAPKSSYSSATLDELTRYSPAQAIELYSSNNLQSVVSLLSAFDSSPLRRRRDRFDPSRVESCSH